MTDVLYGLDGAARERVAALRAQGRFFWLDVSLRETTPDDLRDALGDPRAPRLALPRRSGDAYVTRNVVADGESVVFAFRCYVEPERRRPGTASGLSRSTSWSPATYLLTLHEERVALPSVLTLDAPEERSKGYVVYSVLDMMLVSTFSALEERRAHARRCLRERSTDGRGGAAASDVAGHRRHARDDAAVADRRAGGARTGRGGDRRPARLRDR